MLYQLALCSLSLDPRDYQQDKLRSLLLLALE